MYFRKKPSRRNAPISLFWIIISIAFLVSATTFAQVTPSSFIQLGNSAFENATANGDIPGGILAIVTSDSVLWLKGYGVSDIDSRDSINPKTSKFQLGSVGKVFTAIAVLQLTDKGVLSLDEDINKYLTGWQITNPFDTKITLRHLLTHSAGLDEKITGYMARSATDVQSLETYLSHNLPAISYQPGTQINYSNYGYGLSGLAVLNGTGIPFENFVEANIISPLEMNSTTYTLPEQGDLSVKGYKKVDGDFVEQSSYPRHNTPAGSILSTGSDMAKFLQWLLRQDSLLSDEGFSYLFERQFSPHPKLTGYSLGFEEQNFGEKKVFSKVGSVPGFHSSIMVFPNDDIAILAAINANPSQTLDSLYFPLISLFHHQNQTSDTIHFQIENPEKYAGVFRNNRHNKEGVEELFQLYQSPIEIKLKDNNLQMVWNGWLFECQAENDSLFSLNSEPPSYLVFSDFIDGKPQTFSTNVETNGLALPVTYSRLKWYEKPRFINDEFPVAIYPIIGAYLLIPIFWGMIWIINKVRSKKIVIQYLPNSAHILALSYALLTVWHLTGFLFPLAKRREELLFGFPADLEIFQFVHWAMVCLSIPILFQAVRIWTKKEGWTGIRLYYSLFAIATIAMGAFMYRWHFLFLQ